MRTSWRSFARGIAGGVREIVDVKARCRSSLARIAIPRRLLVLALGTLLVCLAFGITVAAAAGPSSSASPGNVSNPSPAAAKGGATGSSGFVPKPRSLSVGGGSGLGSSGPAPSVPSGTVAVPSMFTATSRTYKSERGIYTTTLYGQTVNTQEANGTWKPIEGAESARAASAAKPAGGVTPNASLSSTASHDCALASNSPTTSICNATSDTVGYDGTNTDNSLVEFELKEALPSGANVLNAQLGMYLGSASTTNAVSVSAYAATKPWTLSATWNTYDGINAWTTPGGDSSTTNAVVNPSVTTPAGWKYWYPTQIVQEWVNGTLTNDGLLLADTTQKTTNDMLSFNSLDASSNKPVLTVSWEPRGQEDPSLYAMQSFGLDDRSTMKVNLASGDLFVNASDLAVKGTGIPFLAEHNYDSLDNEGGSVNPWYSLPGAAVYADGSVALGINRYDFVTFIRKSDGSFLTPAGINATLCAVNGTSCTANSVDGSGAAYALTFNEAGNGPLYAQGNKIDFASNGGILSDADRYGHAIAYHYGTNLTVTDTQGHTFTRNTTEIPGGFHVTSSWVESGTGGREVKYAYNASGKLESFTDALAHKTKYAYDEEGELSEITDPKGNVTKLSYDTSHRITKVLLAEAGGTHPDWDYAYYEGTDTTHGHTCSATGVTKKTVVKDPNGHESTFCANVEDEVLQSFDAAGNETAATYNSLGEPTSGTAAAPGSGESGNVASTLYQETGEGAGRPMCSITAASSRQTSCPSGSGGSMLVTAFNYKDEKNPYLATQVKNPQGNSTFACFNGGKQSGSEGPACPGTATGPSGSVQNINDQLSSEHELSFEYNTTPAALNGTIKASKDARGSSTTYEYDEQGNLKTIKPPTGAGLKETKITVDSDSRPHVITDGAGHIETITYDKLDRITEIVYSGTGTARTVKYEYDSDGNVAKRVDPTGTTKYTVDAINRVTKEELPGSLKNEYGYDAASNITSFIDGGGTTKYKYNNLNELEGMTEPGEAKETTFTYDNDHRLTKIAYPSGAKEIYKLEAMTGRPETITFEGLTGTTVPT